MEYLLLGVICAFFSLMTIVFLTLNGEQLMEKYFNNDVSPEFKQHMENPLVNLEKSLLDLEKRELAKHCQKYKDKEFLDWLADRLESVYKESPNTDFVIRLRKIANNYLENN